MTTGAGVRAHCSAAQTLRVGTGQIITREIGKTPAGRLCRTQISMEDTVQKDVRLYR